MAEYKFDPTTWGVKKLVTRPLLKIPDGSTVFIRIGSPIYKGKEIKAVKEGAVMEPADLCDVIDLANGKECQIIVNAVIKANLIEAYPDNSYVGKFFSITRHAKEKGKRYNTFAITEISPPAKS